jgi:hypothetical protein
MLALEMLAEQRIRDAIDAGGLDNLSGQGRPLRLEDQSLVPVELRAAYRIMRNNRVLPQELLLRSNVMRLEGLLEQLEEGPERRAVQKRLALAQCLLESQRSGRVSRPGLRIR